MGLFNKRNLYKARSLAEKNAAKIASSVDKVTDTVDKKTGGKYSDKLRKVDDAAKKFAKDSGHPVPTDTTPDAGTGGGDASGSTG